MIAGIIGATGYAGAELVRLLAGHPQVDRLVLGSVSFEGDCIERVYPNFLGRVDAPLVKPEEVIAAADAVFAALPSGVGEAFAKICVEKKIPFIDFSADFRFDDDEAVYAAWYGKQYAHPELRQYSVYGLPELNRKRIIAGAAAKQVIIGNPGCYPTGASLGAYPALAKGIAGEGCIIVDSASGVTGGGREPSRSFHYPECADSVSPYKIGAHRHTPEISRNFEAMTAAKSGTGIRPVIFTPHLAPMNRGILSTIYIPLGEAWKSKNRITGAPRPPAKETEEKAEEIRSVYAEFYRDEPFVRILPADTLAATNRVRYSNFCDISVHLDQTGTTLIIATAIDNMVKGAAGQGVQNMNILFGFPETAGLTAIPASF
ncbi:MAG: N-acetyl-gamma-glutamyl-phosphate reductase [Spirochaetaceae bacterium]|jgi:N-acetyl-gamma-glutamyl-phosphate reductase|nr:N-acetyl-gamma-glutamyl-phosphate reductase [Spirochaetaceae bacterium]